MNYIHKDHLGSINIVTNQSGSIVEEKSYDPWGRLRNPTNWTFTGLPASYHFDRGYTGHEHLREYSLINMNGRFYDPKVGRFLSADKIVQAPENSQSYNRYSYCINNPLKYSDPTGYAWYVDEITFEILADDGDNDDQSYYMIRSMSVITGAGYDKYGNINWQKVKQHKQTYEIGSKKDYESMLRSYDGCNSADVVYKTPSGAQTVPSSSNTGTSGDSPSGDSPSGESPYGKSPSNPPPGKPKQPNERKCRLVPIASSGGGTYFGGGLAEGNWEITGVAPMPTYVQSVIQIGWRTTGAVGHGAFHESGIVFQGNHFGTYHTLGHSVGYDYSTGPVGSINVSHNSEFNIHSISQWGGDFNFSTSFIDFGFGGGVTNSSQDMQYRTISIGVSIGSPYGGTFNYGYTWVCD